MMQVYPFLLAINHQGPLTARSFFELVGLHPEVVKVSVSEDIVGTKAVRQRCVLCSALRC